MIKLKVENSTRLQDDLPQQEISYLSTQFVGDSNLHCYAEGCNQNFGFPSAEIFQIKYISKKEKHNKTKKNITILKVTRETAGVSSLQNRQ